MQSLFFHYIFFRYFLYSFHFDIKEVYCQFLSKSQIILAMISLIKAMKGETSKGLNRRYSCTWPAGEESTVPQEPYSSVVAHPALI